MIKDKFNWLEYLGVIILWFLIFGKNVFSNLLFVDYAPVKKGFLIRDLIIGNFTSSISIINILRELFSILSIERVFFSFTILIAMIISYYYISKLIEGKKEHLSRGILQFQKPTFNKFSKIYSLKGKYLDPYDQIELAVLMIQGGGWKHLFNCSIYSTLNKDYK